MEQSDQDQVDELRRQNENEDSELSDDELDEVAGGGHGIPGDGPVIQPYFPNT